MLAAAVLLFTDMRSDFDPYLVEENAPFLNEKLHRAQMYAPYADRALDWFGRERGQEYEVAMGAQPQYSDFDDFRAYILKDSGGARLYFPFACTGLVCSQFIDDNIIPRDGLRNCCLGKVMTATASIFTNSTIELLASEFKTRSTTMLLL